MFKIRFLTGFFEFLRMQYKNRIDKSIQIIYMYRKGYMPHLSNLYTGLTTPANRKPECDNAMNTDTSSDER
jgi:hypothetical protein